MKRDAKVRGAHFKLDDCRVWMRLHFWSLRECGLADHKPFLHWYIRFIEEFIGVYEVTATRYVVKDAQWSEEEGNITVYIDCGFIMKDVVGIGR
jgi:hypothetical protein